MTWTLIVFLIWTNGVMRLVQEPVPHLELPQCVEIAATINADRSADINAACVPVIKGTST
jgi:hypothetical protein